MSPARAGSNEPIQGSFRLPRLEHASVEDAMHRGVMSVPAETPLRDVARALSGDHIHCLIVTGMTNDGARPRWGFVTALDLMRAAEGSPAAFQQRTARDIATSLPPAVSGTERLDHAAQLMAHHGIEHLIVAENGHPAGVLSALDVAGVMAWGEA